VGIMDASADAVRARFSERYGAELRLTGRRLAGEGLSDETGVLEFDGPDGAVRLVVRRYRPGAVVRHEVEPARLHRLLVALGRTRIPVPEALWFDEDPTLFGDAYSVVRWVPGTAVVPWSPPGRRFLAEAGTGPVGELFCKVLADIHAVDWRTAGVRFLGVPSPGTGFAESKVEGLAAYLRRVRMEPEPILTDGIGWLRANLPDAPRTSLLHGDYRTGNMLFDGPRITAVLDWEFATLGDPGYDLGWVCSPSNRMGTDLVCMLLPEEAFLSRYERYSGHRVEATSLRFWVTFHQVRHAVMWLEAGRTFADGATDDLRLARMHLTMPTMRKMVADLLDAA
jgi:aminoglycoside phosphotransferase (APT) family kinase protein